MFAANIRGASLPVSIRPSSSEKNPRHSATYGPHATRLSEMAHGLYQRSIVSPLTTASETLQLLLYSSALS
jgi:hypothetical protein